MSDCCSRARRSTTHGTIDTPMRVTAGGHSSSAIFVRGGQTFIGTNQPKICADGEGPERSVSLSDYYLEAEAVSVYRFEEFVTATGYVTESEKIGSSAVFAPLLGDSTRVSGVAGTPWWTPVEGACWRHPEGPGSTICDRLDHPVTHVSWNDAAAFATWVGGRLPSEAEWEHAARGGSRRSRFPWGDEEPTDELVFCNIWQGRFPDSNTKRDGYFGTAPIRSFDPTDIGFYNMAGNVWEWTADAFRVRSLSRQAKKRNDQASRNQDKVLKGGSFLCHVSYCYRYRIAARLGLSADSASSNAGFRVAYDRLP